MFILKTYIYIYTSGPCGVQDSDCAWNDYDAIYRFASSGIILYVGNDRTAQNELILRKLGIKSIINCTHGDSQLPNYHQGMGEYRYLNFPICYWF